MPLASMGTAHVHIPAHRDTHNLKAERQMLMLSLPSPLGSVWDLSLVIMLFILRVCLSSGKPLETPEMCFHGESKFCQANNQD